MKTTNTKPCILIILCDMHCDLSVSRNLLHQQQYWLPDALCLPAVKQLIKSKQRWLTVARLCVAIDRDRLARIRYAWVGRVVANFGDCLLEATAATHRARSKLKNRFTCNRINSNVRVSFIPFTVLHWASAWRKVEAVMGDMRETHITKAKRKGS